MGNFGGRSSDAAYFEPAQRVFFGNGNADPSVTASAQSSPHLCHAAPQFVAPAAIPCPFALLPPSAMEGDTASVDSQSLPPAEPTPLVPAHLTPRTASVDASSVASRPDTIRSASIV